MYILFSNWFVKKFIIIIIVIMINMLRFRLKQGLTYAKYTLYNQAMLPKLMNIFNF